MTKLEALEFALKIHLTNGYGVPGLDELFFMADTILKWANAE